MTNDDFVTIVRRIVKIMVILFAVAMVGSTMNLLLHLLGINR